MLKFELPLMLALTLLGALSPASRVSAEDTACTALFEQAAAQLGAEQYPRMLRIANDRMQLCPGPESALLLGLAQANMVDSLAVTDPAEREQYRQSALRNIAPIETSESTRVPRRIGRPLAA